MIGAVDVVFGLLQRLLVFGAALVPGIVTLGCVSFLGLGAEINAYFSSREHLATYAGLAAAFLLFTMHVLEAKHWTGVLRAAHFVLELLAVAIIGLASLVSMNNFPAAPLVFVVVAAPLWLLRSAELVLGVRHTDISSAHALMVMRAMRAGLCLSALVLLGVWVYWVGNHDMSWGVAKHELAGRVGCATVGEPCRKAWVLWAAPMVIAANSALLSLVLTGVIRDQDEDSLGKGFGLIRLTAVAVTIAATVLYTSACIASSLTAPGVLSTLTVIAIAMLATFVAILFSAADVSGILESQAESARKNPALAKLLGFFGTLWCKGTVLLLATPLFGVYVVYFQGIALVRRGVLSKEQQQTLQEERHRRKELRRRRSRSRMVRRNSSRGAGSPEKEKAVPVTGENTARASGEVDTEAAAVVFGSWPWTGVLQVSVLLLLLLLLLVVMAAAAVVVVLLLLWPRSLLLCTAVI